MNTTSFFLEFDLNIGEIHKLNKMYFEKLYKQKVTIFSGIFLVYMIFFDFFDLRDDIDCIKWVVRNLFFVIFYITFQYSIVKTITAIIFQFTKKLAKYGRFSKKYKFNFSPSGICVHSPLGEVIHKWGKIEKAILTRDFFFLYIKDTNGYIISISNKYNERKKINELIAFVERNVTRITKV